MLRRETGRHDPPNAQASALRRHVGVLSRHRRRDPNNRGCPRGFPARKKCWAVRASIELLNIILTAKICSMPLHRRKVITATSLSIAAQTFHGATSKDDGVMCSVLLND
jgi:hypothetical protein